MNENSEVVVKMSWCSAILISVNRKSTSLGLLVPITDFSASKCPVMSHISRVACPDQERFSERGYVHYIDYR